MTRDGDELPADLELAAIDVVRVVQKWWDGQPVKTIVLGPNEKFPDLETKNEETPREEWVEDPQKPGQMRGPWQAQHICYLLDLKTMDKYTYPTGTVGGRIAIRELRDKLMWMRRLRGPNTYPVILLTDTFMKTNWGGRQRPHFKIVRWVYLGGEGGAVGALPPPPASPTTQTSAQLDLPLVKEPSLAEELNDEIPDFSQTEPAKEPKAPPPRPTARRDLKKKPAKASAKAPSKKRPANLLDAG